MYTYDQNERWLCNVHTFLLHEVVLFPDGSPLYFDAVSWGTSATTVRVCAPSILHNSSTRTATTALYCYLHAEGRGRDTSIWPCHAI